MICEDFRTFRNGWHVQYVRSARAHKNNLRSKLRPHIFCFAFQKRARALASAKKNLRPQKKMRTRVRAQKKSPTDVTFFKMSSLAMGVLPDAPPVGVTVPICWEREKGW